MIYLFGSTANGTAGHSSDIDLAVYSERKIDSLLLWNVAQEISTLINNDVDLVDLSECSMLLRFEVVVNGKRLFDSGIGDDFETTSISMFQKFREVM